MDAQNLPAAITAVNGVHWDLAWQLPLAAVLVAVAAIDLDLHLIPNKIVYPAAAWGVISAALIRLDDLPTERLVTRLHVGEVEIGEHVRRECEDAVAH